MAEMVPAWIDGTLTPVEKLEVHQRGLRHMAISVFVMNGDKTLLQRRALGKYHTPGLWANTCCTHPRWGEAPEACALRRLEEELGITGLTLRQAGTTEYRAEVGQGLIEHEVVDIFVAQATERLFIEPNPEEVLETAWVALPDLTRQVQAEPARFTPWLRIYLAEGWDRVAETLQATPVLAHHA
ncbi:isopentenyl-diphosphate Delta-isomerase [bacterium]|nr:isopentenyl-diphosphate Delta-isomerase [bacterium]